MDDDTVYVAVGRKVEDSKLTLLWALRNLRTRKVCILHVHIPMDCISSGNEPEEIVETLRELELSNTHESLNDYIGICHGEGVDPEDIYTCSIGMFETAEGIVELIYSKNVKKLVMGAAADNCYSEGMTGLISTKAKYVGQHAPHSCQIWFACAGHLICTGTGDFDRFDGGGNCSSDLDESTSSSSQFEPVAALVPYEGTREDEDELGSDSHHQPEEHSAYQPNMQERTGDDQLYRKVEEAMAEAEKAKRDAFDETMRRFRAEKDVLEALRKGREYETMFDEERKLRKEIEEALAKEKEQLEKTKQERDDTRVLLTEALQRKIESEEALARQVAENEKANKEIEEMRQIALDGQHLIEICKKERDEMLQQRDEAIEILKAVAEESSLQRSSSAQPPSYFMCPISQEMMTEPHVAADGHTYEAEALREWLNSGHDTSPMTNLRLAHRNLVPNLALRSAIQEWLEQHPGFRELS